MTPTRDEWAALQLAGPVGLRVLLYQIAENRQRSVVEALQRRAEQDAATARRQAAFEVALAERLVMEGGEWLAAYRVQESDIPNLKPIDLGSSQHVAEFDPRAIGLHRLRAELWHPDRESDWQFASWYVFHPQSARSRQTLIEAIEVASEYSSTPF